jgi:hypothetical protein
VSRNATETSIECAAAAADLLRGSPIPKISLTATLRAGLQGIRRPPLYSSTMTVTMPCPPMPANDAEAIDTIAVTLFGFQPKF